MVDYEYYVNCYLGCLIPQQEFAQLAMRAKAYLEKLCRIFRAEGGQDARAMAQCAMAEELYRTQKQGSVTAASLGSVSVHYHETPGRQLMQKMYRQAAIYLDFYRGRCGNDSH